MRHRAGAVAVVAAMLIGGWGSVAAADPRRAYEDSIGKPPRAQTFAGGLGHQWRGQPTAIAGTAHVSRGELVYTDVPFDDTGADTTPDTELAGTQDVYKGLCGVTGAYRHGEFAYPSDAKFGKNAADLVEVRVAADSSSLLALIQLQTLIAADTTAVELRFDGGPAVVVTGAGAKVGSTPLESAVDLATNTFEVRVPLGELPQQPTLKLSVAAGTAAGSAMGTVTDLAFVPDEPIVGEFNCWHDKVQSQLIAANRRPTIDIDVDALRSGRSDADVVRRGPMIRVHVPSQDLGEGTVGQTRYAQESTANIYRGKVQPYAIYVPESYDPSKPAPLIVLLHCLTCNHNTFHIAAWPGLKQLAESRGAPVVTPLAYGEGGHYEGEAELDVFDVLADVWARYRIDRQRVYLTGMSMGSLGTFRLGLLHPDLWAKALGVGVYTNPFCVTPSQRLATGCFHGFNYFNVLDNAQNLPFGILNGALDELTPATGAREIAGRLTDLRYPNRYWEYPTRRHEPSLHGLTTDVTDPFLGASARVTSPASITYLIDRLMDRDSAKFGIVHDRAYWVSDIRVPDGVRFAAVRATSGRGVAYTTKPVTGSGTSAAGQYSMSGLDAVEAAPDGSNRLTLKLTDVESLTVDVVGAGLTRAEALTLEVDSSRPAAVRVAGTETVLQLPAGKSTTVLEPAAQRRTGPAPARALPATGGVPSAVSLLLLALGLSLGLIRLGGRR